MTDDEYTIDDRGVIPLNSMGSTLIILHSCGHQTRIEPGETGVLEVAGGVIVACPACRAVTFRAALERIANGTTDGMAMRRIALEALQCDDAPPTRDTHHEPHRPADGNPACPSHPDD
jgi:hypothetical protein